MCYSTQGRSSDQVFTWGAHVGATTLIRARNLRQMHGFSRAGTAMPDGRERDRNEKEMVLRVPGDSRRAELLSCLDGPFRGRSRESVLLPIAHRSPMRKPLPGVRLRLNQQSLVGGIPLRPRRSKICFV